MLPIVLLLSFEGCTNLFFYPEKGLRFTPDQIGIAYQPVSFQGADGTELRGWFLPAAQNSSTTIFFVHGNAENISTHIGAVWWLPREGFNVFLFDPRGYGASSGTAEIDGVHQDVEAGLDWLEQYRPADTIIVYGQSLGGALAITTLARANQHTRDKIALVVVESAFASYRAIVRDKLADYYLTWPFQFVLPWFVRDSFSPERFVAELAPLPLLFVHGRADQTVPSSHSERLFEKAKEPKKLWLFDGVEHTAAFRDPERRARLIREFREAAVAMQKRR